MHLIVSMKEMFESHLEVVLGRFSNYIPSSVVYL